MGDQSLTAGPVIPWSWQPVGSVETVAVSLPETAIDVVSQSAIEFAVGLSPEPVAVSLQRESVEVMSIPLSRPAMKIVSFAFGKDDAGAGDKGQRAKAQADEPGLAAPSGAATPSSVPLPVTVTRFKPPRDVVKLEDRLFYVLQPPLETQIAGGSLEFPFHPFPYQFEGVAFLYPRIAAVLADEMGLGKTMQAITAIRLLLHAGQLQPRVAGLPEAARDQLASANLPCGRRKCRWWPSKAIKSSGTGNGNCPTRP